MTEENKETNKLIAKLNKIIIKKIPDRKREELM